MITIYGHGNKSGKVCILAQNPGKTEANLKQEKGIDRPLIGASGKELDKVYFPKAGITREDCYLTNVVKDHYPEDRDPNVQEIAEWESYLINELSEISCSYIITLGSIAKNAMGIEGDLYDVHGVPVAINGRIVIPTYHPAAAMKGESKIMQYIMDDFEVLGKVIRGEREPIESHEYSFNYFILDDPGELEPTGVIAIDTESCKDIPFSVQVAVNDSTGWWIDANNREVLNSLWHYTEGWKVILHNALYDIPILQDLGLKLENVEIHDSMIIAYHMGNIPKSLKTLSYRLFGIKMKEYKDVLAPYQNEIAINWLMEKNIEYPDIPKQMVWKKSAGDQWETMQPYAPRNLGKRIQQLIWEYNGFPEEHIENKINEYKKSIIRKEYELKSVKKADIETLWSTIDNPNQYEINAIIQAYSGDKSINLYERYSKMDYTSQAGEMPEVTLKDIPTEIAMRYGCLDAIMTLKVWRGLNENSL